LLLFPDVECSFELIFGILVEVMPDLLNGVGLEMVSVHLVLLVLLPGIKDLSLETIAINHK